jgi:hypothetical protein
VDGSGAEEKSVGWAGIAEAKKQNLISPGGVLRSAMLRLFVLPLLQTNWKRKFEAHPGDSDNCGVAVHNLCPDAPFEFVVRYCP